MSLFYFLWFNIDDRDLESSIYFSGSMLRAQSLLSAIDKSSRGQAVLMF